MKLNYPLMENNILSEDLEGVISLLKTKDPKLTAGPKVREFEELWSKWLGCKYSVFVNSGSSSNLMAICYLKLIYPKGGKIIIPPFTWSSDVASIIHMGFEPLFVDIKLSNLAIDPAKLEDKLKKEDDILAVFLTHAQGLNGLPQETIDLCKKYKVHLIEDVCESHGVVLDSGEKAGTKGLMSCFSFYYAHHMSTIEGGMVCTNDKKVYDSLKMMRAHGLLREVDNDDMKNDFRDNYPDLNPQFIFTLPGFNFRNNEIGALIGINQLKRLDLMIKKRVENFEYFVSKLPYWAFKDFNLKGQSNYAFNLILNEPDNDLMKKLETILNNNHIEFRRGSAGGGNQLRQPYLDTFIKSKSINPKKDYPVADHIHFYGMYIGNFPTLKKEKIDWLIQVINNV